MDLKINTGEASLWIDSFILNINEQNDSVLVLRAHFEGMDQVDKRELFAKNIISTWLRIVFYHKEHVYSFKTYATTLRKAYTILELDREV